MACSAFEHATGSGGIAMTSQDQQAVPGCAEAFNWGAFLLTGIWALRNKCLNFPTIALFLGAFLPHVGSVSAIALALYMGRTGGRRSWVRAQWRSEEAFIQSQRRWARAGFLIAGVMLVLAIAALAFGEV